MNGEIYVIPQSKCGGLAVMPRPRSADWLEDAVYEWSTMRIGTVVSLLTADEVRQLVLSEENLLCQSLGIRFESLPVPDRGLPPSAEEFVALVGRVQGYLEAGERVAVHCRQGVGRSAMVAAGVLVVQGYGVDQAFGFVQQARGMRVPDTEAQREWVREVAPQLRALRPEGVGGDAPSEGGPAREPVIDPETRELMYRVRDAAGQELP
jgi:protein-tyrosine phosphatase